MNHEADSPETHSGKILVMDLDGSEPALGLHLEAHGFQVTRAFSLEEAYEACNSSYFETLFSVKTRMDEECVAFSLRLQETPNALSPTLVLSPTPREEAWVQGVLEAGVLDCVTGPIAPGLIIAKLKAMVRFSRLHAAVPANARQQALLEVTGGAAHELSQPLASAKLLLDILERQREHPSHAQMTQLRDFVQRTSSILDQIRNLTVYVTKPYASGGSILDLEQSRRASGGHRAYKPKTSE